MFPGLSSHDDHDSNMHQTREIAMPRAISHELKRTQNDVKCDGSDAELPTQTDVK